MANDELNKANASLVVGYGVSEDGLRCKPLAMRLVRKCAAHGDGFGVMSN
jgi:hypothetical protein